MAQPAATHLNAPDLRKEFPRSPNETLGGYVILPRIIDKCRAVLAGTNGEYNYNCPLDQRFFNFAQVDAEAFKAQVAQGKDEAALLEWIKGNSKGLSEDEILVWSYQTRWDRPQGHDRIAYFEKLRLSACPNHPRIETWFQLLDAEEGRF
jgi:hypothetical protein